MEQSLVALWKREPDSLREKSCQQVVSFAGKGELRDNGAASEEFRSFLALLPPTHLARFAEECLEAGFKDSGLALQDIVNEIGSRLGFEITHGRYRGRQGEPGFDGLWVTDEHTLVVEVKTTDAYRISLDVLAGYRNELIQRGEHCQQTSSILIAAGRQDTGDLEAQIRGSRHAWDVRLVSIDRLVRMMHVKEQTSSWTTSTQINRVLIPIEYTRVDEIIDLLFETTRDVESTERTETEAVDAESGEVEVPCQHPTDAPSTFDHDAARARALDIVGRHLGVTLRKKGRVFWSSEGGQINVVCLSSRPYAHAAGPGFWYGFKPGQRAFMEARLQPYLLLVCGNDHDPLLIPGDRFFEFLKALYTSPSEPTVETPLLHHHVSINYGTDRVEMSTPHWGGRTDVTEFRIPATVA